MNLHNSNLDENKIAEIKIKLDKERFTEISIYLRIDCISIFKGQD